MCTGCKIEIPIILYFPSSVILKLCNNDDSVYYSAEQDMAMKENENETLNHDSRSFRREVDVNPLSFRSKEAHQLNSRDDCWNPKFIDDLSTENQNGNNLVGKDNNLFTDKILLECEKPQFIVCKEINCHVVKDICVDEGILVHKRIPCDNSKDNEFNHSFPRLLNDDSRCEAIGASDRELLLSDELAITSLENTDGVSVDEHGFKEEIKGGQKLPSESFFNMDSDKDINLGEKMQKGKTNLGPSCASKDESFVDKTLPIQEFGTRSFLGSCLDSLDGDEYTVKQLRAQISSGEVVSTSPGEAGPQENVRKNAHDQSLSHNGENFVDLSSDIPLQFDNSKNVNPMNSDSVETVNSHFPEHDSSVNIRRYDEGESSFIGAGLVTFSGQISYSGSLSLRSDGSATSGRSFAFPILQPEWNSSPVRMNTADGRHFRKHKGWRSGILCCRF